MFLICFAVVVEDLLCASFAARNFTLDCLFFLVDHDYQHEVHLFLIGFTLLSDSHSAARQPNSEDCQISCIFLAAHYLNECFLQLIDRSFTIALG